MKKYFIFAILLSLCCLPLTAEPPTAAEQDAHLKTPEVLAKLEAYRFDKFILEVAIATYVDGGATARIDTREFLGLVDKWGFPKYPEKTAILPSDTDLVTALKVFVQENETYLIEPNVYLGTWINPQNNQYYLDIMAAYDSREEALRLAKEHSRKGGRRIVALYHFLTDETYYINWSEEEDRVPEPAKH